MIFDGFMAGWVGWLLVGLGGCLGVMAPVALWFGLAPYEPMQFPSALETDSDDRYTNA